MPETHPGVIAIDVIGGSEIPQQTRTYAEYRVFAVLTKYNIRPHHVRLLLRTLEPEGSCREVACEATLDFHHRDSIVVSVRGAHPYAAINRAVDRIDIALSGYRDAFTQAFARA